jgi:hypothetical protein
MACLTICSRPAKALVKLVLGLVGFVTPVHLIPNRMIEACPNLNDGQRSCWS